MFSILHIHTIILFFPAKYMNLNQLYETLVTHAQGPVPLLHHMEPIGTTSEIER